MKKITGKLDPKWLLFFYSVPSKPVNSRIKIWRKLAKIGAIQMKGAVYILPYNEENYEFLQWLASEVTSLKGDGTFIVAEKLETMTNSDIIDVFNKQRETDYQNIEKGLEELERRISSIKKGTGAQNLKKLSEQFTKYLREFDEVKKIDFFSSKAGNDLKKKIKGTEAEIKNISGFAVQEQKIAVIPKCIEDYQRKTWVTRKKPFIDRIASAWLIKKFIDKNALFKFIDEKNVQDIDKKAILFDIRGGEFTHQGDLCTFETLLKAFGLKAGALKKIAEIVHELDIKDEKYKNADSKGIEDILIGIRKTVKDDAEILEKGMNVFEMFYASKI